MASGKISRSVNGSEDQSLETTIPTDFTLSPESDEGKDAKLTLEQQLDRKQLLHDLQLLKIELSHKSNVIDNMKAEYMTNVDNLEEKVADVMHQKQVIQTRLEAQLKVHQEESRKKLNQTKTEMEVILKKQQQLEATNARLQERAGDIKRTFCDLELNEDQYYRLKTLAPDLLSLKDFIAVRIYEICWPLKMENVELRERESKQKEMLSNIQKEYSTIRDEYEISQQQNIEFSMKIKQLQSELKDLRNSIKDNNYKSDNFDRIKIEKEKLDGEVSSLKQNCSTLQNENNSLNKERVDIFSELKSLRQTVLLLKNDKDYFIKQVFDLNSKLNYAEERLLSVNNDLEKCKEAKEEIYEQYAAARDKYKGECNQRLNEEIEKVQQKTDKELEKLKISQTELHDSEIRVLMESRDIALSERDKSVEKLRETKTKYDELRLELNQLHSNHSVRFSELRSELKLKTLELERTQIMETELSQNFQNLRIENEKLTAKLEIITKELYSRESSAQVRIAELELLVSQQSGKLVAYEKLENELDDIVIQAAEAMDSEESERMLFSFGYGANVPTTAKRRLQQSVQLARRILMLEKLNMELTGSMENEKKKNGQLVEELCNLRKIFEEAQQPHGYVIDKMRIKDEQLKQMSEQLKTRETELNILKEQNDHLIKIQNQMAQDLERLLQQKMEMNKIKNLLYQMQNSSAQNDPVFSDSLIEDTESSFCIDSQIIDFPKATILN